MNNGLFGNYPKNFHIISKNKGSREDKKLFKKKCKNFAIDSKNRLIKLKEIKDEKGNVKVCDLICVPDKYKKVILDYFHIINIHCSFIRLSEIIYNNNYYWTGIYEDSKLYVQNCDIFVESDKKIFKKPYIKYLQAKTE